MHPPLGPKFLWAKTYLKQCFTHTRHTSMFFWISKIINKRMVSLIPNSLGERIKLAQLGLEFNHGPINWGTLLWVPVPEGRWTCFGKSSWTRKIYPQMTTSLCACKFTEDGEVKWLLSLNLAEETGIIFCLKFVVLSVPTGHYGSILNQIFYLFIAVK